MKKAKIDKVIPVKSDGYPRVSIIIITFNSADSVEGCLSSVFKVNYPRDKYEVIVVDSGSTDGTLEIVKKFPVDKLIVEEGALRGKARNIGVREATGEIVAMVDSDLSSTDDDWLARAVKGFNGPQVALVRGSDLILLPSKNMNFFQRAIYYLSVVPSRILLRKEDWNGK